MPLLVQDFKSCVSMRDVEQSMSYQKQTPAAWACQAAQCCVGKDERLPSDKGSCIFNDRKDAEEERSGESDDSEGYIP